MPLRVLGLCCCGSGCCSAGSGVADGFDAWHLQEPQRNDASALTNSDLQSLVKHPNMHKVIVVGDGRIGKTSLLRCLRGEPFRADEKSTSGAEVLELSLSESSWQEAVPRDTAEIIAEAYQAKLAVEQVSV